MVFKVVHALHDSRKLFPFKFKKIKHLNCTKRSRYYALICPIEYLVIFLIPHHFCKPKFVATQALQIKLSIFGSDLSA